MKKQFLLIFMIIVTENYAQTFQNIYHFAAATENYLVEETMDGGYILLTNTDAFGVGHSDIYLIKLNAAGDTVWTHTFGGLENDYGNFIKQTADSGYIIAGETRSFGIVNYGLLLKVNSSGNLTWSRIYGGIYTCIFRSVDVTNDGGYIAAGWTDDFGVGGPADSYIVKTDSLGNILWTKTFGGINNDEATSIKQTISGDYIIAGGTFSFGAGLEDIYLIKISSTGNLIWSKTYGGTMVEDRPKINVCADNGFIVTSSTKSFGAGMYDVLLMKTDSSGIVSWAKTYGGVNDDLGNSVQQTSDGGFVIAGYTSSFGFGNQDVYLIRTDSMGDTVFTKTFGSASMDLGWSVIQCSDGGFAIGGETIGFQISSYGFYFIKTDNAGYAGCNEIAAPTITGNAPLQVTNQIPQISAGGSDSAVAMISDFGGFITPLCSTVGTYEYDFLNSIEIYPVPAFDEINISGINFNSGCEIQIINATGVVLYHSKIKAIVTFHKLKNLNLISGIYFVKVFDNEKCYRKKLIVGYD